MIRCEHLKSSKQSGLDLVETAKSGKGKPTTKRSYQVRCRNRSQASVLILALKVNAQACGGSATQGPVREGETITLTAPSGVTAGTLNWTITIRKVY